MMPLKKWPVPPKRLFWRAERCQKTLSAIGIEPDEQQWVKILVSLLRHPGLGIPAWHSGMASRPRHPGPGIPALARQAMQYLAQPAKVQNLRFQMSADKIRRVGGIRTIKFGAPSRTTAFPILRSLLGVSAIGILRAPSAGARIQSDLATFQRFFRRLSNLQYETRRTGAASQSMVL
jgi:hypothetical protein